MKPTTRAKFRVNTVSAPREVTQWLDDGTTRQIEAVDVTLYPVTATQDNPENKEFYANTPGGSINLQTINLEVVDQFVQGREFYIDFIPADQE